MFKQRLYHHLIHSQHAHAAAAFVLVFAFVACNIVAARHNLTFADSLLPTNSVTVLRHTPAPSIRPVSTNASSNSTAPTQSSASDQTSAASSPTANGDTAAVPGQSGAGLSSPADGTSKSSSQPTVKASTSLQPAITTPAAGGTPGSYPLHSGIKTTWFYAGEPADADDDYIQNVSSAWQENWQNYFGGSDNPVSRCGYNPCGFTPRENPFYFALPFSDFTDNGPVANLNMVYWYNSGSRAQLNSGQSILKNRWLQITANGKTAYAQWEDVGPFIEHDSNYVFGSSAPQSSRAGLDVSPAVRDYFGMGGSVTSSWRFVDASDVPAGPWKTTITTSGPDWN